MCVLEPARPRLAPPSRLAVPGLEAVELAVPSAERRLQLVLNGMHPGTIDDRDDDDRLDHQLIQLDEQCRPLDGVELCLGGFERAVVFFAAPAGDVAPLP